MIRDGQDARREIKWINMRNDREIEIDRSIQKEREMERQNNTKQINELDLILKLCVLPKANTP